MLDYFPDVEINSYERSAPPRSPSLPHAMRDGLEEGAVTKEAHSSTATSQNGDTNVPRNNPVWAASNDTETPQQMNHYGGRALTDKSPLFNAPHAPQSHRLDLLKNVIQASHKQDLDVPLARKRPVEVVFLSDSDDERNVAASAAVSPSRGIYELPNLRSNSSRVSLGHSNKFIRLEKPAEGMSVVAGATLATAGSEEESVDRNGQNGLQNQENQARLMAQTNEAMKNTVFGRVRREQTVIDVEAPDGVESRFVSVNDESPDELPEFSNIAIASTTDGTVAAPSGQTSDEDVAIVGVTLQSVRSRDTDVDPGETQESVHSVDDLDSEDELQEVTKEEAEKTAKFKATSFSLYPDTYYNKPIPVHHAGEAGHNQQSHKAVASVYTVPVRVIQDRVNEIRRYSAALTNERYRHMAMFEKVQRVIEARHQAELVPEPRQIEEINYLSQTIHNYNAQVQALRSEEMRLQQVIEQRVQHSDARAVAPRPVQPSLHFNPYERQSEDEAHLRELFKEMFSETKAEDMAETPAELLIKLLDHQRQGLQWLVKKEEQKMGVLLADDMGLGKTVQTIALIVANAQKEDGPRLTLIVGPVSLLRQWEAELETKLKREHTLRVVLFHNTHRRKLRTFQDLAQYDIVLVSYTTLANECKKHFGPAIEDSKSAGNASSSVMDMDAYQSPFYTPDATFYRIVLDEAHYIKNKDSQTSQAAVKLKSIQRLCLTGTPMQNKIGELYPLLKFLRTKPYDNWLNFSREIARPLLPRNDNADKVEVSAAMKRLRALLAAIMMRRTKTLTIDGKPLIVLPKKTLENIPVEMTGDEKQFYMELESTVQKTARDLLNAPQHKTRSFAGILSLLMRLRQACVHRSLVEVGELRAWQKHATLRKTLEANYRSVKAMPRDVRKQIHRALRQRRESGSASGKGAESGGGVESGEVNSDESRETDGADVGRGTRKRNGSTAAEIPALPLPAFPVSASVHSVGSDSSFKSPEESESELRSEDSYELEEQADSDSEYDGSEDDVLLTCPLCLDVVGEDMISILAGCGHMICNNCVSNLFESTEEGVVLGVRASTTPCMTCQKPVSEAQVVPYPVYDKITVERLTLAELIESQESLRPEEYEERVNSILEKQNFEELAKIDKVLEIIGTVMLASPKEKIIIFSNFTVTFDLMKLVLDRQGLPFLRYDGTMSVDQKNSTVERFYQGSERILLLSLRAGNVGLTLTCASHVIIMEPFWNPYVEEQAMDRVHRLGQLLPVKVYRILAKDSVENRIMELQERKKLVIGLALDENALKLSSSLGRTELGYLFGLNNLD